MFMNCMNMIMNLYWWIKATRGQYTPACISCLIVDNAMVMHTRRSFDRDRAMGTTGQLCTGCGFRRQTDGTHWSILDAWSGLGICIYSWFNTLLAICRPTDPSTWVVQFYCQLIIRKVVVSKTSSSFIASLFLFLLFPTRWLSVATELLRWNSANVGGTTPCHHVPNKGQIAIDTLTLWGSQAPITQTGPPFWPPCTSLTI